MELEKRTPHEPPSSSGAYFSALEELDVASSSVYTTAVEDAEESNSSQLWTSIDNTSDSDDKGYVRVLPGKIVRKYTIDQITLLEKIGEGAQGTIYTARLDKKQLGPNDEPREDGVLTIVVKLYKGRKFGEWPEVAFGLHLADRYLCRFHGYCLEGDSFYLLMQRYDCSLRDVLDKQMKLDNHKGRPLPDIIALNMIIQIAIGMWSLHDNNILHRDLKADNVFVTTSPSGVPVDAHIGDFDVASYVVGTSFWRAPEVLKALKDGRRPVFTPKTDVYSYAMTCYEILTGGVPLQDVWVSDYDAVLQHGKRPKLPYDLNPKLKAFLGRCWHQDPEARPTSKEIVAELRELHKDLITGSEFVSNNIKDMFRDGRSSLDMIEASPDDSLLELKTLLQAILVKYNHPDYLVLLMEFVADVEQYQSTFGLRSMKEHPELPFREYYGRLQMYDRFNWKFKVFERLSEHIVEMVQIARLCETILQAISEGDSVCRATRAVSDYNAEVDLMVDFAAWKKECQTRVLPDCRYPALQAQNENLQELLNAEYTSHMRCGGSGQILSVCRQWLGID